VVLNGASLVEAALSGAKRVAAGAGDADSEWRVSTPEFTAEYLDANDHVVPVREQPHRIQHTTRTATLPCGLDLAALVAPVCRRSNRHGCGCTWPVCVCMCMCAYRGLRPIISM
jgi:hypothetical protein